jgi:hypothetical protein
MSVHVRSYFAAVLFAVLFATVGGCNNTSSPSTSGGSVTPGAISPSTSAIAISGTPVDTVTAGASYSFQPIVTHASSTSLHFSVTNPPVWAKFDASSGALSGTPAALDAGSYPQIVIAVSDGAGSASLPPFTIAVKSGSSVVATLSWTPPTPDVKQPAPLNLAGYRIYYGTSEAGMTKVVTVNDPTSTSYVVDNLSPGTWYFAVSAYDTAQAESALSPAVAVNL